MVNDYFDCLQLIKQCINVVLPKAELKKVHLEGPVLANPLDKYYFMQICSDEGRHGQCILNFLSNGIKFTSGGGTVSVHLRVIRVFDVFDEGATVKSESVSSRSDSDNSIPDKEVRLEEESEGVERTEEKVVSYEMIFRDTGTGISPENQQKLFLNFGKL